MKTRKLSKEIFRNIAYGYDGDGYVSAEMWIDSHSDVVFKPEDKSSSIRFEWNGDVFCAFHRIFNGRVWSALFVYKDARAVIQSMYDFLYV